MSNFLAFANVTAALRDLLDAAVQPVVPGAHGTIDRPDTIKGDVPPGANVYLYQVTPNAAWRNADLPTRRVDGTVGQRPQAAFDLHYMLTFYGRDSLFEPQLLLGTAVSLLHAQPVLSPAIVQGAAQGPLAASDLAAQVELVRLTPTAFSLEELSKLWSVFFQVPYKLSVAYQASVVLVEPDVAAQPALPVRARNLFVAPFRQPEIDEVAAAAGRGLPIQAGDTVVLRGRNLRGDATRVRIGDGEAEPKPGDVSDAEVRIVLDEPPFPSGTVRAGVAGIQIVQPLFLGTPPTLHAGAESNLAAFVLRPRVKTLAGHPDVTISPPDPKGIRTVTVGIAPQPDAQQRVALLLNEPVAAAPRAFSAVAEPRANAADPVIFKLRGLATGTDLLVRVQVDGAESPLDAAAGAFDAPKVTVP